MDLFEPAAKDAFAAGSDPDSFSTITFFYLKSFMRLRLPVLSHLLGEKKIFV